MKPKAIAVLAALLLAGVGAYFLYPLFSTYIIMYRYQRACARLAGLPLEAVPKIVATFADASAGEDDRTAAVQFLMDVTADSIARERIPVDYESILRVVLNPEEDHTTREEALQLLGNWHYPPAGAAMQQLIREPSLHPYIKDVAIRNMWRADPALYQGLPEVAFDENGEHGERLAWLTAAGNVVLSEQDLDRLFALWRAEDTLGYTDMARNSLLQQPPEKVTRRLLDLFREVSLEPNRSFRGDGELLAYVVRHDSEAARQCVLEITLELVRRGNEDELRHFLFERRGDGFPEFADIVEKYFPWKTEINQATLQ